MPKNLPHKVFVNAVGIRTGGSQTFLTNLLPLIADILPNWNYCVALRQDCVHLYSDLPRNIVVNTILNESVSTYLMRLKFEHFIVPKLHRERKFSLHFQVDEMLSPMVTAMDIPSVAVFHTTPMVLFDDSTGDSWLFRRYARYLRQHTARKASIPVTVSHHAKAEFAGLYPFARDRFHVVYHGIDLTHFSPDLANESFISSLGVTRPYLLSVSNRFEWKNYYRLVQAYQQLIQTYPSELDLLLVGEAKKPAEEARIQAYIDAHGLRDRVHLVDFVTQANLPEIYRGATAYIFPSMRETFGLTVLEAMACGIPVACARWGPLPEVAGDAVHYFDPLDITDMTRAIFEVCENTKLRQELVQLGLQHVQYFTWQRAAAQYKSLMLEAVKDL